MQMATRAGALRRGVTTLLLLAALMLLATATVACAWADTAASPSPPSSSPSGAARSPAGDPAATADGPTQADVQAFVERAVAYAKANGKDKALASFTAPGGEFHDGELYIFAYDFSGTVIAHGGNPSLVGKNLIGMQDPNGVPVIKELVRLARSGAGWLYYTWPDPQRNNAEEPKLGYVERVDDTWFLGSGTYGSAAVEPPTGLD
jgi:hypothetical protein